MDWDEDSVDAEPWLAFKHDAHARTTTLAMAAIDPDAGVTVIEHNVDHAGHGIRAIDCRRAIAPSDA